MAKTLAETPPLAALAAISAGGFATPQPLSQAAQGGKAPNFGGRRAYFMLSSHPSSWELLETADGWRLLPVLSRLIVAPGVNGTAPAKREGQAPDPTKLEVVARQKYGQTVLQPASEYLVMHPSPTGAGHFLRWERLRIYPDGVYEVEMDEEGWRQWRWSLVTSGRIAPPRGSVLSQMRTRLSRRQKRATRTPHLAAAKQAMEQAAVHLEGLVEATEALQTLGADPAPSKSRRRTPAGAAGAA